MSYCNNDLSSSQCNKIKCLISEALKCYTPPVPCEIEKLNKKIQCLQNQVNRDANISYAAYESLKSQVCCIEQHQKEIIKEIEFLAKKLYCLEKNPCESKISCAPIDCELSEKFHKFECYVNKTFAEQLKVSQEQTCLILKLQKQIGGCYPNSCQNPCADKCYEPPCAPACQSPCDSPVCDPVPNPYDQVDCCEPVSCNSKPNCYEKPHIPDDCEPSCYKHKKHSDWDPVLC